MATITRTDIDAMEKLYRINLINSCSGYKSANLIATQSSDGFTNVAVFSSVTHLGSNPPLLGFVTRPAFVPRNTYENIKETGIYTINHIHRIHGDRNILHILARTVHLMPDVHHAALDAAGGILDGLRRAVARYAAEPR